MRDGSSFGFTQPITAVVIGARGGIGRAVAHRVATELPGSQVIGTSRSGNWVEEADDLVQRRQLDVTDEASLDAFCTALSAEGREPDLVFNAAGVLHGPALRPERTHKEITLSAMRQVFLVNTFSVALLVHGLLPLMPKRRRSVFASLSARVGSIADNRLGGWYSYRSSKAAQNMMLRCAAIEAKRTHPGLLCLALHPGTVRSELSAPFTQRRPQSTVFSPDQAARYLDEAVGSRSEADTGTFVAWDGQEIEW